jgi:hypothetical protein
MKAKNTTGQGDTQSQQKTRQDRAIHNHSTVNSKQGTDRTGTEHKGINRDSNQGKGSGTGVGILNDD